MEGETPPVQNMKETKPDSGGYILAAILLLIVAGLFLWIIGMYLKPKASARMTCNDFASYADIMDSFRKGNRGLDGDNDGIPCENRR